MRLLEFESKAILEKYQIAVPSGTLVTETDSVAIKNSVLLKPQVPVGGRQKAGGILEASTADEVRAGIKRLLSKDIRGFKARKILIEEKLDVEKEYFMAITCDSVAKSPRAVFSIAGGVEIESVAMRAPEKMRQEVFAIRSRLPQYRAREIIAETGVSGKRLLGLSTIFSKLAEIFLDYDATLAEINPLVLTKGGRLVALDCHLEIDDDALFRHNELVALGKDVNRFEAARSVSEFERQAEAIDQIDHRGVAGRVIEFEGDLGLIIGGGGASLTAFDAVQAHGGKPANYCEIGGNPSVRKVEALTRLILSKPNVKRIAVIMNVVSNTRVDLVARGIIKGILKAGKKPSQTVAVFRVPGAWEQEGFKILSKYGVKYLDRTASIDDAARIAVRQT